MGQVLAAWEEDPVTAARLVQAQVSRAEKELESTRMFARPLLGELFQPSAFSFQPSVAGCHFVAPAATLHPAPETRNPFSAGFPLSAERFISG